MPKTWTEIGIKMKLILQILKFWVPFECIITFWKEALGVDVDQTVDTVIVMKLKNFLEHYYFCGTPDET